jgi:hypothetical protein
MKLKRETHGTRTCYVNGGCRCDLCRKASADYQRQSGGNLRRGTRGDHKRRWDDENRAVCACGNRMERTATTCRECWTRQNNGDAQARYAEIKRLWKAGWTIRQIARSLGTTPNAIGKTMVEMRKGDWDLPYRYKVDATGRRVA